MRGAPALVLALVVVGCGEEIRPLPAAVDAVLEARCRRCHGDPPAFFAPVALVTWNDTHRRTRGKPLYVRIGERIHDAIFPMPPVRAEEAAAFDDAQRAILDAWIGAGAPPAEP